MLSQPEQPWQPGPNDVPFTTRLISPHGDRHPGFNDADGRFHRLWQHRRPGPLHTGDTILLRPSDIDQIIKFSMLWVKNQRGGRAGGTRCAARPGLRRPSSAARKVTFCPSRRVRSGVSDRPVVGEELHAAVRCHEAVAHPCTRPARQCPGRL
ncbi:hypothetical protein [Streptomyces sp. NPDC046727]|uniref:hypothetical protein n=1 Tax=Streptomyces sp. NPDC046727 TaxID=3155373 RepID=UPI0033D9E247